MTFYAGLLLDPAEAFRRGFFFAFLCSCCPFLPFWVLTRKQGNFEKTQKKKMYTYLHIIMLWFDIMDLFHLRAVDLMFFCQVNRNSRKTAQKSTILKSERNEQYSKYSHLVGKNVKVHSPCICTGFCPHLKVIKFFFKVFNSFG